MNKIKNFYVFDFLKNFFKWHNVPMMIYLLMNLIFIYIGTIVFASSGIMAYYDENPAATPIDVSSNEFYLVTAGLIALIYFLAISISLSPIGEWILRKKLHCNVIQDEYTLKRIYPIFQEVYLAAREKSPAISDDVKIFIQQSDDANAFAVGRRSVCITTGLLKYSDNEIKGILGHEFGHLAHKDTDMNLVVNIANWMTNIIFLFVWIIIYALKFSLKFCKFIISLFSDGLGALFSLYEIFISIITFLSVYLFQKLWLIIGNLLLLATSRGAEYKADKFSYELGYGDGLLEFFYKLPDSIKGHKNPFKRFVAALATVGATHPRTWKRIEAVQKIDSKQVELQNNSL